MLKLGELLTGLEVRNWGKIYLQENHKSLYQQDCVHYKAFEILIESIVVMIWETKKSLFGSQ